MIKKILCPTDGSEHAEKAVELASDLAAKYEAELVFLHVQLTNAAADDLDRFAEIEGLGHSVRPELERLRSVQSQTLMAGGAVLPDPVSSDLLEQVGEYALQSARQTAASKGVSQVSTVTERGDTGRRILDRSIEEGVDMIVMGSRGLSSFKSLLQGSVSQYVSSRAPCTCVTVN